MLNRVTETHTRTVAKLVIYRIISILITFFLALAFNANTAQAFAMSAVSLIIGSTHYYLYDRLSLFVPWGRTADGNDTRLRSIIKTIVYRVTVILVMMITSRMIFLDSNWEAFLMAAIKFCTHAITYFTLERVFNRIDWGKKQTS
jgi:uncharacterized membrane protein